MGVEDRGGVLRQRPPPEAAFLKHMPVTAGCPLPPRSLCTQALVCSVLHRREAIQQRLRRDNRLGSPPPELALVLVEQLLEHLGRLVDPAVQNIPIKHSPPVSRRPPSPRLEWGAAGLTPHVGVEIKGVMLLHPVYQVEREVRGSAAWLGDEMLDDYVGEVPGLVAAVKELAEGLEVGDVEAEVVLGRRGVGGGRRG